MENAATAKTMQLATVSEGKPWICTVYFALLDGALYWLSLPERRHSRELAADSAVAAAIAIKTDKPVIGLQIEGTAKVVADIAEIERVLSVYVEKYGQGKEFVQRFLAGENKHTLYKLTPKNTMLFDELNASQNPHRKVTL